MKSADIVNKLLGENELDGLALARKLNDQLHYMEFTDGSSVWELAKMVMTISQGRRDLSWDAIQQEDDEQEWGPDEIDAMERWAKSVQRRS